MAELIKAYKKDNRPVEPLPPARLHDPRYIHATTLLLAGVPVHVVAGRLGHAADHAAGLHARDPRACGQCGRHPHAVGRWRASLVRAAVSDRVSKITDK
ncbi:phage integrase family protein [Carbonactinospora thermoautotrophica]|uniref:Phage integrase family protein n=1 Tax=Carbonactinospora thermoautotrophica TaxID=1469144 RepID=A0A132N0Q1_9ACTN|nr:hypothetical protein [Carbonactinospora thermoautotrophica]KWX03182.1 phage integrase family protein [Carbonactinospora thermoautotrophica]